MVGITPSMTLCRDKMSQSVVSNCHIEVQCSDKVTYSVGGNGASRCRSKKNSDVSLLSI